MNNILRKMKFNLENNSKTGLGYKIFIFFCISVILMANVLCFMLFVNNYDADFLNIPILEMGILLIFVSLYCFFKKRNGNIINFIVYICYGYMAFWTCYGYRWNLNYFPFNVIFLYLTLELLICRLIISFNSPICYLRKFEGMKIFSKYISMIFILLLFYSFGDDFTSIFKFFSRLFLVLIGVETLVYTLIGLYVSLLKKI